MWQINLGGLTWRCFERRWWPAPTKADCDTFQVDRAAVAANERRTFAPFPEISPDAQFTLIQNPNRNPDPKS